MNPLGQPFLEHPPEVTSQRNLQTIVSSSILRQNPTMWLYQANSEPKIYLTYIFFFWPFLFSVSCRSCNMPAGLVHPSLPHLPYCLGLKPANKSPIDFSTSHSSYLSNLAPRPLRSFEGRILTCTFK